MITFQQMATLIKQGYNEEQIKQINAIFSPDHDPAPNGTTPAPNPEPITNPNPAPAPAPAPEKPETQPASGTAPQPQAPESPTQPGGGTPTQSGPMPESETQKMLREMLGIMRTGAINTMQQPTTKPETTESILAKVLEP